MDKNLEQLRLHPYEWNFFTFEKYIDQRFSDAEKAVNAALSASDKAVNKAEAAQQLRNESQNEFRKSLSDLSGLMWTIKEGTAMVDSVRREIGLTLVNIEKRVSAIENLNSNLQGRIWAIGAVWGIIVLISSFAVRFIGH